MRISLTFFFGLLVVSALSLSACGSKLPTIKPFKLDIQQGNVVTSKMLMQLRPGMTKSQVRFIMGTPLVVDSFHGNRWDYFYQLRQQGKIIEQRRVILDFENDLLSKVRGDVVAATDKPAEPAVDTSARSVTPPSAVEESSWLDTLMFWKRKPAVAAAAVLAVTPAAAESAISEVAAASGADAPTPETESVLRQTQERLLSADAPVMPVVPVVPVVPESSAEDATKASPEAGALASTQEAEVVTPGDLATQAPEQTSEPSPAPASAQASELAQSGPEDVAIKQTVTQWAEAWRSKQVEAYLSAYADTFKPEGGVSKKSWMAQRKQRLSPKQGAIRLVIEDVAVERSGNQAIVTFWQQYSSKVYSDQVTKQLNLEWDSSARRWRIVREFVISNAKKASQQTIVAPEETSEHLEGVIEQIGF